MPHNGTITIEPGAKLFVNGGTITDACNNMWQGIVIQGIKNDMFQNFTTTNNSTAMSNQGFVYMNNAIIENAVEAVQVWDPADGWVNASDIASPIGKTGGIIRAENTKFINNRRSVAFMWYKAMPDGINENSNKSSFANCIFTTNDNHSVYRPFNTHVSMWGVMGVPFTSCTFENAKTTGTISNVDLLGTGLRTIDASYSISKSGLISSMFKNLTEGIFSENANAASSNRINFTVFDGNLEAVKFNVCNYSQIKNNSFKVGNTLVPLPIGKFSAGVSLVKSTQFKFDLNNFTAGADKETIELYGTYYYNTSQSGLADNLT